MEEGDEIRSGLLTNQIGKAQSKVEGIHFANRKHTLERRRGMVPIQPGASYRKDAEMSFERYPMNQPPPDSRPPRRGFLRFFAAF